MLLALGTARAHGKACGTCGSQEPLGFCTVVVQWPDCPSLPGGVLSLLEHGEEYVFTLPSAYARSILTIPWVELGGKVSISCAKTGYSATVTFHTKPFYGGKVHR